MDDACVAALLGRLGSASAREAWSEFLEAYAALLLQVIRLTECDPDRVGDCFVFVCERLSEHSFARLRRFEPGGPASFATWLRVVTRHLAIDWRRSRFGRLKVFRGVASLSTLHQQLFTFRHRDHLSVDQAFLALGVAHPGLTMEAVVRADEEIEARLEPHHRTRLAAARTRDVVLGDEASLAAEAAEPGPDPEVQLAEKERLGRLRRALADLDPSDALLLRLRFDKDLTLTQVARVTGLRDAQVADRRIRRALKRLEERMD
jgi:RNA polymerase sigma factor (sigma-70 family)